MPPAPSRWRTGALLAPAVIAVALWWLLPLAWTLWSASSELGWVLSDGGARLALRNTVAWVLVVTIGASGAGLGLAWLADRLRAQRLLVTVVAVPTAVALPVVAMAWRAVFAFRPAGTEQVGLLNGVLGLPGLDPVAWLVQAPLNTLLLAGVLVWVQTSVVILVLSVAIGRVPGELRDAATVDGASDLQVFGRMILPNVKGALAVAALSSAAVAIKVFDLVVVATDGQYSTAVLGTESIHQALRLGAEGRGAALAVVMVVLLAPLGLAALVRARRSISHGAAR